MSKPVKVLLGAAGVLALFALVLGLLARERRPSPPPRQAVEPAPVAVTPTAPVPGPAPAAPPPVSPAAKPRRSPAADAGRLLDEAALLARINALGPSDLPLSLALAREGVARFPDSPNAPEFHMNIAKSLLHLGRLEEARDEARLMLEKYPGNHFALEVEHHLLRNPPNPKP